MIELCNAKGSADAIDFLMELTFEGRNKEIKAGNMLVAEIVARRCPPLGMSITYVLVNLSSGHHCVFN